MNTTLTPDKSTPYRPYIDGLRAIAVLSVIINHVKNGLLPSGFLGVDIFFVISGYVVTSSLMERRHRNWKEYLLGFYIRRFKRLVPALSFCVLLTCLLSILLVSPLKHLLKSGAFSLVGMSNIFFLKHSTDYFATAAELNPFTHTWSLGVEEQFYFIFPILLGLCGYCVGRTKDPKRNLVLAIVGIAIPSFSGFVYLTVAHPSAAFFLMPTRFWEFGAGCLTYALPGKTPFAKASGFRLSNIGSGAMLLALLGILSLPRSLQLISVPMIVCATSGLILLMDKGAPAARLLSTKPIAGIGLLSYSLYLWHWPMLSLSKYVTGVTKMSFPAIVGFTLLLSWVSYRYIEKPLRKIKWTKSEPKAIAFSMGVLLACFGMLAVLLPKTLPEGITPVSKFLGVPESPPESFKFLGDCFIRNESTYQARLASCLEATRSDSTPNAFYLLGDSHAQKMAGMVMESIRGTRYELRFLIANLDSDFPYPSSLEVSQSPNLEKVLHDSRAGDILALTFHRGHLNGSRDAHVGKGENAGENEKTRIMRHNLDPYMEKFAGKGVKILFIRDVPLLGSITTVETCMMQEFFLGVGSLCRVDFETDMRTRSRQDAIFDGYAKTFAGVAIWDPAPLLFKNGSFDAFDKQRHYLMIDWHHISSYQENLLIPPFKRFLDTSGLASGRSRAL